MRGVGAEKKITLEEYVDFINSAKSIDFTCSYLNQVHLIFTLIESHSSNLSILISVDPSHSRLPKASQIQQGEAVDAVDLLDLSRSTLNQTSVSSSASLTLDQVISDIEALKWQECCLTSLQIISSDEVTPAVASPKQQSNKRKIGNQKKKKKMRRASDL
ncbi:hypothetical protein HID58_031208 [Brassica napus]|uniref:DUF7787 domain-containing protein n=1 Tax=Brassica napus TaxID=3708 RepID=A0ABQ8CJ17_BRANA|nr:hypothetical protein HID58_031208 [Brassica napus]